MSTAWEYLWMNAGEILSFFVVGMSAVLVAKAHEWWSKRISRLGCRRAINQSVILSTHLSEIRALTDADRLTIMQFHNGDHFASGASVQKVSITHCILRAGVSMPTNVGGDSMHYFPATFVTHALDAAFRKGYAVYLDDKEAEDHWLQRFHTVNGVITEVICLIPGSHPQEAFGLLSFSWIEPHAVTEDEIRDFIDHAKKISAYL